MSVSGTRENVFFQLDFDVVCFETNNNNYFYSVHTHFVHHRVWMVDWEGVGSRHMCCVSCTLELEVGRHNDRFSVYLDSSRWQLRTLVEWYGRVIVLARARHISINTFSTLTLISQPNFHPGNLIHIFRVGKLKIKFPWNMKKTSISRLFDPVCRHY